MRSRTLLFLLLLAACDTTTTPDAPSPYQIADATDLSNGIVLTNQRLPQPLRVLVTRSGSPAPRVPVEWHATSGTLLTDVTMTDAAGYATDELTTGLEGGSVEVTATVQGSTAAPVRIVIPVWPRVTPVATISPMLGDHFVGSTLAGGVQLQVTREGFPWAGTPIVWSINGGAEFITSDPVSDRQGMAKASIRFGTTPGPVTIQARVRGAAAPLAFQAEVIAGPVAAIRMFATNWDTTRTTIEPVPGNFFSSPLYVLELRDAYDHVVVGEQMIIRVISGEATIRPVVETSTVQGLIAFWITPKPGSDPVVVEMQGQRGGASSTITIPIAPVILGVQIDDGYEFVSERNGTRPAVDTIAVGDSLIWRVPQFDYESHTLEFTSGPELPPTTVFPYGNDAIISHRFTKPGTYLYRDADWDGTGMLVVVEE